MRIVSLLPSATEIVYALGVDSDLLGVTFECNEPPAARQEKRIVVGGKDTSAMSPEAIDRYVRDQLSAGADLYTLHRDALADLQPDLILTQDLCQVCAVPTGKVRDAVDHLGCTAEVLTLDPYTLDEVLGTIMTVAFTTAVPDRGTALVAQLSQRLKVVERRARGLPRRRVAVIEWVDPVFGAGHWMPDMVTTAGGLPVAAQPGARSIQISWAQVEAADPQVVVVAPCGYALDGAIEQAQAVVDRLPDAEVWAIDADGLMVRPGPRLVDGVEALASILHPAEFTPDPSQVQRITPDR